MTLLSYVLGGLPKEFRGRYGDKHEYFSETLGLALVKAVIAHAARRAESDELPDCVPAEFRTTHVGKLRKALCGTRPSCSIVER